MKKLRPTRIRDFIMTKEELIAKSGQLISKGFINILLDAYEEGYKAGLKNGKLEQKKLENISRVRFFDFNFESNTIWATYKKDESSIYSYNEAKELGLNIPTKEQALEFLGLEPYFAQHDGFHHLHFKDIKQNNHGVFYYNQGAHSLKRYEGVAIWWKQEINESNLIEAVVLKYNQKDDKYYFAIDKINVNDNYLTLFVIAL